MTQIREEMDGKRVEMLAFGFYLIISERRLCSYNAMN